MSIKRLKAITVFVLVACNLIAPAAALAGFGGNYPNPDCSRTPAWYTRCAYVGYFSGVTPFPLTGTDGHNEADVLPATFNYGDPVTGQAGPWAFPNTIRNGLPSGVAATNFINFINGLLNEPQPIDPKTGKSENCTISNPNPGNNPGEDEYDVAHDIENGHPNYVEDGAGNLVGYPDEGCWAWRRQRMGAAFIVLTMLADPGDDHGNSDTNGVSAAIIRFNAWAAKVVQADQDGLVDWDRLDNEPANHLDSTSEDYGHDVTVFINTIPQNNMSIIFTNSDGSRYIINRSCGNTDGLFSPINVVSNYFVQLTATGSPPTIVPGGTGTIHVSVQNNGPAGSDPGRLQIQYPGARVTPPCSAPCTDPNQTPLSFGNPMEGYWNSSGIAGAVGTNWFWTTQSFLPGTLSSGQLTFTVPANAAPGPLTFDVWYAPANQLGDPVHKTVTFTISRISYPGVVGLNSDIHAGGGICNQAAANGSIIGNGNAQSYGQYVVSSTGAVGNVGSNNSATSTQLTVGQNGNYSDVCRPDLYHYAINNMNGAGWTPGGTFDVGAAIPGSVVVGGKTITFINGNATIHGTLTHPLTIIASGNVTIDGAGVTVSGGTTRANVPTLGVIANGDININNSAQTVDGLLFSDGTINTCAWGGAGAPTPPTCANTLTVTGFLMANSLALGRLGPLGTGAVRGETIVMDPALYLNPPAYFDSGVDLINLQGNGERPPLF